MEEGGGKRRIANFTLLPVCYHRSKHCKFCSILARTTFSRVFIATCAYFTLYSSADCGWMEFDYFRIVTGGWVQVSLVGWEKKPCLHRCDPSIKILRVIFNVYVHHAHSRVHLYRIQQYLKSLCAGVLISKIWFFPW